MRRRNIAVTLLAGALLLGLAACGSDNKSSGATTTAAAGGATTTAAAGGGTFTRRSPADTLTVVTNLPGPGFWDGERHRPERSPAASSTSMAKAMQAKLGMKNLKVRNENFDAIVSRRGEGLRHRPVAGHHHRRPRPRSSTSPSPYFESQQGILVKAGTPVTNLDDAKKLKWARADRHHRRAAASTTSSSPTKEAQAFQDLVGRLRRPRGRPGGRRRSWTPPSCSARRPTRTASRRSSAQFAQPGGPDKYGAIYPKGSTNKAAIDALIAGLHQRRLDHEVGQPVAHQGPRQPHHHHPWLTTRRRAPSRRRPDRSSTCPTPSGVGRRRACARGWWRASSPLLGSIVVVSVTARTLTFFYDSLDVSQGSLTIWAVVLWIAGVEHARAGWASASSPWPDRSQARRLAAAGDLTAARMAADKAKDLIWYVGGIGATVLDRRLRHLLPGRRRRRSSAPPTSTGTSSGAAATRC